MKPNGDKELMYFRGQPCEVIGDIAQLRKCAEKCSVLLTQPENMDVLGAGNLTSEDLKLTQEFCEKQINNIETDAKFKLHMEKVHREWWRKNWRWETLALFKPEELEQAAAWFRNGRRP